MNLDYIHKNDIHEKYVLGQLSNEEKIAYESFLKENEQSRLELDEARKMIEGIRAAGADSMRKEIERQVEEIRTPKADWSLLYKAAAVLFVFVLVPSVVYFQLFDLPEKKQLAQEKNIPAPVQEEDVADEEMEQIMITEAAGEKSEPPARRSQMAKKKSRPAEIKERAAPSSLATPKIASKDKVITAETFNDALGKTEGVSSGYGSLGGAISSAKQSKGVLSDLDIVTVQKNYSYQLEKKSIQLSLIAIDSLLAFPNSFPIKVTLNNENNISLECRVSQEMYLLEKKDIFLTWDKDATLQIAFITKNIYEVTLIPINPAAKKIRNKD